MKKINKIEKRFCLNCNKEIIESGKGPRRKYCSNDCYIRDRFWRKEDTAEIMKKLIKGEKVENIPK